MKKLDFIGGVYVFDGMVIYMRLFKKVFAVLFLLACTSTNAAFSSYVISKGEVFNTGVNPTSDNSGKNKVEFEDADGNLLKVLYVEDDYNLSLKDAPYFVDSENNPVKWTSGNIVLNSFDDSADSDMVFTPSTFTSDEIFTSSISNTNGEVEFDNYVISSTISLPYDSSGNTSVDVSSGNQNKLVNGDETIGLDNNTRWMSLKLNNDVILTSTINIGGHTGFWGSNSGWCQLNWQGFIIGNYSSLDLNGHDLIVTDGAVIDSYGLITDSSSSKAGNLVLGSGSTLYTDFVVEDHYRENSMPGSYINNGSLFSMYRCPYWQCNTIIYDGAEVLGKIRIYFCNVVLNKLYLKGDIYLIGSGQTTATLALTSIKDKADLSNVFVQMKLTIASDKTDADFVTNIATYANNQTKITSSDLASNHPLYATLASISEHLYTPTRPATRWIFEKNRGSYEQMTLAMSKTEVNKFKMVSPKQQLIKKTDLAKYENSYRRRPFKVAWGAEVNLDDYQEYMVKEYEKDKNVFNQNFYKEIVGKAILYKHIGALISDSDWYKENVGYRAQLVTYTFSKLMDVLETKEQRFDFMQLWQQQSVPSYLDSLIMYIALKCFDYFYNGSHPEKNISVLCKKEDCWKAIKDIPVAVTDEVRKILISKDEYKANQISAKHEQKRDNAVADTVMIYRISPEGWQECLDLGTKQGILNPKEQSIISSLIKSLITGRFMISEAQIKVVVEALGKLKEAKIFKDYMIKDEEE